MLEKFRRPHSVDNDVMVQSKSNQVKELISKQHEPNPNDIYYTYLYLLAVYIV